MSEIRFGIAGWSYPDWKGVVYPSRGAGRLDQLGYVAKYFDTVELNNTFYRIPESKMVENWARRVKHTPRFRFTAKLWQGFTHGKEYGEIEISQFIKSMEPLAAAGRLGTLLAQYPVSFKNDDRNRDRLAKLAQEMKDFPMVVEFRHRSWIDDDIFSWMEDHQIGFCNVDEPAFRKMLKPSSIVTAPTAYVRFHGRNYKNWFAESGNRDTRYDYLYAESELDEWVPRIEEMSGKAKDLYVVGNNHFRGQAPANILQLKSKTIRGPVDVPEPLLKAYPQLEKVAANGDQPSLF